MPLDEAFHFLEEHDAERVPVVERGRLVGVLSRSVLQRRLAEDEEPVELGAWSERPRRGQSPDARRPGARTSST